MNPKGGVWCGERRGVWCSGAVIGEVQRCGDRRGDRVVYRGSDQIILR